MKVPKPKKIAVKRVMAPVAAKKVIKKTSIKRKTAAPFPNAVGTFTKKKIARLVRNASGKWERLVVE